MLDAHGLREELANALGHLVISHTTLECALEACYARVACGGDMAQAARQFGRRSFPERVQILSQAMTTGRINPAEMDRLDRLLPVLRELSEARNEAVHCRRSLNWIDANVGSGPCMTHDTSPQGPHDPWADIEAIRALTERIDHAIAEL